MGLSSPLEGMTRVVFERKKSSPAIPRTARGIRTANALKRYFLRRTSERIFDGFRRFRAETLFEAAVPIDRNHRGNGIAAGSSPCAPSDWTCGFPPYG